MRKGNKIMLFILSEDPLILCKLRNDYFAILTLPIFYLYTHILTGLFSLV